MRVRLIAAVCGLAVLVFGTWMACGADRLPPPSAWIPSEAIVAVEFAQPKQVLDLMLDPKVEKAVTALPAYEKAVSQPGFQQFVTGVRFVESQLGTDWRSAVRKLLGGGVSWAAEPRGGSLLVIDSEDGALLTKLHDLLASFAKSDAAGKGEPDRIKSREYRGATIWNFNKDEAHAIVGNRFLLSNRPEMLQAALDLRQAEGGSGGGKSLASLSSYQAARSAAGADAAGSVFVNLAAVKMHPPIQAALSKDSNPLAALLFAGVRDALRQSNWLAMGLKVQGDSLALEASVDGKTSREGAAEFTLPSGPDDGALPNLSVPRSLAALSFYRDLHGFYAAKDKLFPERTSGLIFFENMMGIFFSGRDLTDEVLAQAKPEIRVVVAAQKYDAATGTPQIQVPAFAAIIRVRNPKQFGEVIEEAWQKAVGLVSFTRGQKGQAGLIVDRPLHEGTQYTLAYFPTAGIEDKSRLPMQYNFRPALVKLGDYVVLSSTDGLAKDLIDAIGKETAGKVQPQRSVHSMADVDLGQIATLLVANRDNLVRQNMLEKGSKQEEAELQADLVATVLRSLGKARLTMTSPDGQAKARLQIKLNLPQ